MKWSHQLVFRFDATTLDDFDQLSDLDLVIEKALPKGAHLDGHDFGLGEYNIFIHTSDPVSSFSPIAKAIERQNPGIAFTAGYRSFDEDEYIVLWPPTATKFVVS